MASIESVLLFIRSLFRSRQLKEELFQIALFGGKVHDSGQMPLRQDERLVADGLHFTEDVAGQDDRVGAAQRTG